MIAQNIGILSECPFLFGSVENANYLEFNTNYDKDMFADVINDFQMI